MNAFVGAKIINAEPMSKAEFEFQYRDGEEPVEKTDGYFDAGYHVVYPDGYHSWSPKRVFEEAYRGINVSEVALVFGNATSDTGVARIAMERVEQQLSHGFDAAHDDNHGDETLAHAAACYAMAPDDRDLVDGVPRLWPWEAEWWKPGPTRSDDLRKAGALCAAALDRRKRKGDPGTV